MFAMFYVGSSDIFASDTSASDDDEVGVSNVLLIIISGRVVS